MVSEITPLKLFEFFLDTAKKCSSAVIFQTDEEMSYNLFEEFDAGVRSFFHEDNLQKLFKQGMINETLMSTSKQIRQKWIELDSKTDRLDEIRTAPEWRELFRLGDELNHELRGDQDVSP